MVSLVLAAVTSVSSSRAMRLRSLAGVGGVVPDRGQVGDQLLDPGLLVVGELAEVLLAGVVIGFLGLVLGAQGGVPVGFEGVGDEPVGGVDGQVAAAGQVGVVAGAFDVGCAQRVSLVGPVLKFGLDGEGGFDGQRGEVSMSSMPIRWPGLWPGDGAQAQYTRFESGYDPSDRIDQAIMATRTAVFPEHGLLLLPCPPR